MPAWGSSKAACLKEGSGCLGQNGSGQAAGNRNFRPHKCTDTISALFGTAFMTGVLLHGLRCKEWDLQITSGKGGETIGKLQFLPILVKLIQPFEVI